MVIGKENRHVRIKSQKANNGGIIQRQQQATQQKNNEGDYDKGF
jgi:hypothetical protein